MRWSTLQWRLWLAILELVSGGRWPSGRAVTDREVHWLAEVVIRGLERPPLLELDHGPIARRIARLARHSNGRSFLDGQVVATQSRESLPE